jgi:hypothetical protein
MAASDVVDAVRRGGDEGDQRLVDQHQESVDLLVLLLEAVDDRSEPLVAAPEMGEDAGGPSSVWWWVTVRSRSRRTCPASSCSGGWSCG